MWSYMVKFITKIEFFFHFMSNFKVRHLIFGHMVAVTGTTLYIKLYGYLWGSFQDMVYLICHWSN